MFRDGTADIEPNAVPGLRRIAAMMKKVPDRDFLVLIHSREGAAPAPFPTNRPRSAAQATSGA